MAKMAISANFIVQFKAYHQKDPLRLGPTSFGPIPELPQQLDVLLTVVSTVKKLYIKNGIYQREMHDNINMRKDKNFFLLQLGCFDLRAVFGNFLAFRRPSAFFRPKNSQKHAFHVDIYQTAVFN